jgi:hypothetical protein
MASSLLHLRYEEEDRLIWADGLCIQQSDTAERNQQVDRMGDIYERATRVVVWLGNGDPKIDFGFSVLQTYEQMSMWETITGASMQHLLHCDILYDCEFP